MPQKWILHLAICLICFTIPIAGCSIQLPNQSVVSDIPNTPSITTSTTSTSTTKTTTTVTYAKPTKVNGKVLIQAPLLHQFPEYPTGCESVATVMALRHIGEKTSVANFIDNYLDCNQQISWINGKQYGPNPYEYFVGDPRSENSYGCMSTVIKRALIRYFGNTDRVYDATGTTLPVLCKEYIDCGIPVIVWGSIGMIPITDGSCWELSDSTEFVWPNNEHCLLLVGYDANRYYFNDPYVGKVVGYSRSIVEQRYEQLGMQALLIK